MTNRDGPDTGSQLRRWGPLVAIVLVAIVVVVVLVSGGGDDGDTDGDDAVVGDDTDTGETDADTDTGDANDGDDADGDGVTSGHDPGDDAFDDGIVSWSEAEAAGITDEIAWGDRCDTDLGTHAYPSFFISECFAPFEGDNGGETHQGVTQDTIKVVWYTNMDDDPVLAYILGPINNDDRGDDVFATVEGLVEFYGSYFETYGRKVELIRYDATGGLTDAVAAIADAETIARDIKPFMVWNAPTGTAFAEELVANGVMCMCLPGGADFADANSPYLHAITLSTQQSRLLLTEYIGKRLAGRNAVHSGEFQDQERVFGHLYLETSEQSNIVAEGFRDQLSADYGVDFAELVPYELDPFTIQEQAATRIARLKAAGVTSIVFAGDPVAPGFFTAEATAQDYFPEWILAGSALVDTTAFARTYDQEQWRHAFGMSNLAARAGRETRGYYFLYNWFHGEIPPADDTIGVLFHPAVFFPVIQNMGPDVTPQNYIDAIFAAAPTARGALTQPSISFGDQDGLWPDDMVPDYNGIDDVSEIWWDPDATGVDELDKDGVGMYQWVNGGQRYLPGQWPETDPDVFNPEGAVSFYVDVPESERAAVDYPSPAG